MLFDFEKTVQTINFFARKSYRKNISKLDVLELIFLADRYHLRKYGRAITGDDYWAMESGPVPSAANNICDACSLIASEPSQCIETLKPSELEYIKCYLVPQNQTKKIHSKARFDQELFSKSEIEAMEAAWEVKMNLKKGDSLSEFTHHFPEWKRFEAKIKLGETRIHMPPEDFFLPSPKEKEYEYCPAPRELVELNKEFFLDSLAWDKYWRTKCYPEFDKDF